MSAEIITMLGGFATLLASGGTFAMFMFRLFVRLEGRVDALAGEVADFLLSLHDAEPDFGLIGLPQAGELPAVRWKVVNLQGMKQANPEKHARQRNALELPFQ